MGVGSDQPISDFFVMMLPCQKPEPKHLPDFKVPSLRYSQTQEAKWFKKDKSQNWYEQIFLNFCHSGVAALATSLSSCHGWPETQKWVHLLLIKCTKCQQEIIVGHNV
jgi:hypothetical protein